MFSAEAAAMHVLEASLVGKKWTEEGVCLHVCECAVCVYSTCVLHTHPHLTLRLAALVSSPGLPGTTNPMVSGNVGVTTLDPVFPHSGALLVPPPHHCPHTGKVHGPLQAPPSGNALGLVWKQRRLFPCFKCI